MADPVSTMAVIGTEMEPSDKVAWISMSEGWVFKVLIVTYLTDALLHFLRHTLLKWCRRLQKVQVLLNEGHLLSLWQWVFCPQPRHNLCIVRGGDLRRVWH